MNKGFYFYALFLFMVSFSPAYAKFFSPEEEYAQMIQQAQSMPADYDFEKLRENYSRLESYRPYSISPSHNFSELFKRQDEGDKSAIKDIDAYVLKNFALPEAHSRAMIAYEKEGNMQKAAFHEWATKGLIKALKYSGDGKSAQTAYKVLIVSEEYLLARWEMDRKTITQTLKNERGRMYDVLSGKNIKTGESMSIWFDVTQIFSAKLD